MRMFCSESCFGTVKARPGSKILLLPQAYTDRARLEDDVQLVTGSVTRQLGYEFEKQNNRQKHKERLDEAFSVVVLIRIDRLHTPHSETPSRTGSGSQ